MREAIPVDEEGVIAREDDFCRERWPRRVNGQWNQIRALCEEIGVWRLFEATHRLLVAGGWGPEFVSWNAERSERSWIQSQREKVSYYSREDKGAPMVRLLLHRSSENELVFLVITHPLAGTCFWHQIRRLRQYRTATAV